MMSSSKMHSTKPPHADLVVIGAGSAGAVIAARATENAAHDVLLLEAGPDYPPERELPGDLADGTRNSMTKHDWGLGHRPTPRQVVIALPRGKVVGGSSAVNTCIALRGDPYDYDEWAARGLGEWSWDKCLPAFKRLENDRDIVNEWHSQSGPIHIRRHTPEELTLWNRGFLDACASLGYPKCTDTNDPTQGGAGPHAMNKIDGKRMSAARGYLTESVRARPNLRIQPDTLVRRILFDDRRRVVGLEVETNGRVWDIHTRKVILSAGAIATPQLLQRSGVGPRDVVDRLGIDLVADVPQVGARLLDHPGCALFFRPKPGIGGIHNPIIQCVMRVTSEGSACPNDMQVQPGSFMPLPLIDLPWFVTMSICVGKPRGIGRMWTESADARAKPRIESQFLVDDVDRARAVDALLLAWKLVQTSAMKDLATPFWPPRRVLDDRASLDRFVWRITGSGYHPCGTVPMGTAHDPDAACDPRGRVHGVEGLVVADASVMPTIPMANTNLPTLMIGERFGEWAREGQLF
jgi:choline dehydrogenase